MSARHGSLSQELSQSLEEQANPLVGLICANMKFAPKFPADNDQNLMRAECKSVNGMPFLPALV